MANLSRFKGGLPSVDGEHVVQRFVNETEYAAIAAVSDPDGMLDPTSPNYDPEFTNTLYYVSED